MKKRVLVARVTERMVQCPECLTLETLWFRGDKLLPSMRFTQKAGKGIHHGCGTDASCLVLRGIEITGHGGR